MTDIHTISVTTETADVEDAGTNSPVVLGIGGIEFWFPDTDADDFERGVTTEYTFDPTSFGLTEGDLQSFPVYLRVIPLGVEQSAWGFRSATVRINGKAEVRYSRSFSVPYWMEYGTAVHLRKHYLGPAGGDVGPLSTG